MRKLPLPVNIRQKWFAGACAVLACAALYTTAAALSRARAVPLNVFEWEQAIPFWSITVWTYLAQYPLLLLAFGQCRDLPRCGRFLYAALLMQAWAAMIYLAYPVRAPRPDLTQLRELDRLSAWLVRGVHTIDAPVNCLPSLHVSSCLLCLWLIAGESRPFVRAFALASLICIASTLTFKQHYVVDLLLGAVLAAAAWGLAGKLTQRG